MKRKVRRDEASQVLNKFRHIVHALRVTAHGVEDRLGISGAQLFVLQELAAEPAISIRRLSERTLTDPSSVSVVAAKLVARELVVRQRDATDARRSVLSLSARGRKVLTQAPKPFNAQLAEAVRALPKQRLKRLNDDLAVILKRTGAKTGGATMFFDEKLPKARP